MNYMKPFRTSMCIVLLTLSAVTGYSQPNPSVKSFLFAHFPATIDCTELQLSSFFTASEGQNVNVVLANNFMLSGTIYNNLVKYDNLHTIMIKLTAFNNSLFSLSKQTDEANNNTYIGRIINPSYNDGFELKRNEKGNYQFVKIDMEKILVHCNQ